MSISLIYVVLLFLTWQNTEEVNCEKVHISDVEKVVTEYFNAAGARDYSKMKRLTTDDFILYERGMVWNNDSLINFLGRMGDIGISYELGDMQIEVDCNSAFVSYINYGVFVRNDSVIHKMSWTESANLKKVDDTVKLHFLHSTVAKH